jgi:hypothetical protein
MTMTKIRKEHPVLVRRVRIHRQDELKAYEARQKRIGIRLVALRVTDRIGVVTNANNS